MSDAPKSAVSLLIIDDNARRALNSFKRSGAADLEILTASDPEEGLDLVHRHQPQIVLTDLVMPG